MAKINYVSAGDVVRTVEVEDGLSVMEGAIDNSVPGIDADCGGNCACATCHVFVDPAWLGATGERSEMETSMLDFAEGVEPNSRLACQITVTAALDGLIVRTPVSQH